MKTCGDAIISNMRMDANGKMDLDVQYPVVISPVKLSQLIDKTCQQVEKYYANRGMKLDMETKDNETVSKRAICCF